MNDPRRGTFPDPVKTFTIVTLASAGLYVLASCCGIDCKQHNESGLLLRSIPVAAPQGVGPSGPAEGKVLDQTYTIDHDGSFSLHQKIEKNRYFLGIEIGPLNQEDARRLGAEPFHGVLVREVQKNGPAALAGVLRDDIIYSFSGKEVSSADHLEYLIDQAGPAGSAEIGVLREGKKATFQVTPGKETEASYTRVSQQKLPVLDDRKRTGLRLVELNDAVRLLVYGPDLKEKGLLVVDVRPGGPGFSADLRVKDCIVSAGSRPVTTLAEYSAAIASAGGDKVQLKVYRDGGYLEPTLHPADGDTSTKEFNLLGLVKYRSSPSEKSFSLLWGLLFDSHQCYSVSADEKRRGTSINCSERHWGAVLGLIAACKTPRKKELRLLWLFPITLKSG